MTPEQAKAFLSRTEWYEMAELAKIQPMPDHVREMRRKAESILKQNTRGQGNPLKILERGHVWSQRN